MCLIVDQANLTVLLTTNHYQSNCRDVALSLHGEKHITAAGLAKVQETPAECEGQE